MNLQAIFCSFLFFWFGFQVAKAEEFRIFVQRDPVTLHPLKSLSGGTSHVLNNIFRGYYRYDNNKGLISELAVCRHYSALEIRCQIAPNLKYANGERITVEDFLRTLYQALSQDTQPLVKADLLQIKNAKEILNKKADLSTLGVKKISDTEFSIAFASPDRDFLYRTSWLSFTPLPADISDDRTLARDYATGPYRLKSWERGRYLILEPNPFYHDGAPPLSVKVLVVSDETTALKLFQTSELDFLRRVPTEYYHEVKNYPGFGQNPLLRMDYLGFGGELADQPLLRQAMAHALDYEEFRRAFFALGRPGCFGVSSSLMGEPVCYDFNLKKAKSLLAKVDPAVLKKKYKLFVSDQGGDHVLRTGQWYQAQWKKHLGLQIDIEVLEQGVLTEKLKTAPPDLFRRGFQLDRPTCLSAIEIFLPGDPDNFLQLNRPKVTQIAEDLRRKDLTSTQKMRLCREAMKDLLSTYRFIPLGEIHFITLTNKSFSGVELNALNQLNLSRLRKLKLDQSPSEK